MAAQIKIPAWPTTLDCISWSSDNWIAVACGEQIAIVTPRLKNTGRDEPLWDTTLFRANAFTIEEVPMLFPLSFQNFSIGEEQSHRHVQALAWSAPHLGKHARCILAVLSTNHVLSLWECEGKPTVAANWHRKVVVNHAIRKFYGDDTMERAGGKLYRELDEQRQVNQRIRSFCWSPPVYRDWSSHGEDSKVLPYIDDVCQWLAVATDAGHILLINVQPPKEIRLESSGWRVEVVHRFDCNSTALDAISRGPSMEDADDLLPEGKALVADYIAWSPWEKSADKLEGHAMIAFIGNRRLFAFSVKGDPLQEVPKAYAAGKQQEGCQLVRSRSDLKGPLRFMTSTNKLTLFGDDLILCVDLSDEPEANFTSHHLDGRWDEPSGLTSCLHETGVWSVNIVSHLSSAKAETASLPLPLREHAGGISPGWQQAIRRAGYEYSRQSLSCGKAQERVWGMATSPLGDLIVTATTLLPADFPSYVITSEEEALLEITQTNSGPPGPLLQSYRPALHPTTALSPEALVPYLRAYLRNNHQNFGGVDHLVDALRERMDVPQAHSLFDNDSHAAHAGDERNGFPKLRQYLRIKVYLHPRMIKTRLRVLINVILRDSAAAARCHQEIIQHFVDTVAALHGHRSDGLFSQQILSLHRPIRKKLYPTLGIEHTESREQCAICSEPLEFESLKWARCKTGHQFPRCGLTFLAIQRPGISKYCTFCDMQFLNESQLPALRNPLNKQSAGETVEQNAESNGEGVHGSHSNEPLAESTISLARLMFTAFDLCIYCGGNFVG